MKIAYLGPRGSFSEQAVQKYIKDQSLLQVEFAPLSSLAKIIDAVRDREVDLSIAPIENSVEGIVASTLDKLISEKTNGIKIIGEIFLTINQSLLGAGDARIADIMELYSHPQGIAQCEQTINKLFNHPKINLTRSTSEAAQIVAEQNDKQHAAIASGNNADIYGLAILKENINDSDNNTTRFVVLGRDKIGIIDNQNKISLIFVTKNKPGALLRAIEVFDVLGINMVHISSRPSKRFLGEYIFFAEVEGREDSKNMSVALEAIKEKTDFIKILGSYPVYKQ